MQCQQLDISSDSCNVSQKVYTLILDNRRISKETRPQMGRYFIASYRKSENRTLHNITRTSINRNCPYFNVLLLANFYDSEKEIGVTFPFKDGSNLYCI